MASSIIKCNLLNAFKREITSAVGDNEVIATSRFFNIARDTAWSVVTSSKLGAHFDQLTMEALQDYLLNVSKYVAVDYSNSVSADVDDLLHKLELYIEEECSQFADKEDDVYISDENLESATKPKPAPKPKPSPKPSPKPAPKPSPKPAPKPAPKPVPKPAPEPAPVPKPAPEPAPVPKPAPEPAPVPKPAPAPIPPATSCAKDPINTKEVCCTKKALLGDFSDPECNPAVKKPFNWKFWGIVLLIIIILAIIGFFVYKKFFAPRVEVVFDDNMNFNNSGEFDNYGNEGLDVEDLEILNMPLSPASAPPVAASASP